MLNFCIFVFCGYFLVRAAGMIFPGEAKPVKSSQIIRRINDSDKSLKPTAYRPQKKTGSAVPRARRRVKSTRVIRVAFAGGKAPKNAKPTESCKTKAA